MSAIKINLETVNTLKPAKRVTLIKKISKQHDVSLHTLISMKKEEIAACKKNKEKKELLKSQLSALRKCYRAEIAARK